ncbi:hypothetical protein TraAM80_04953, partial [Trypanosoma rangeli]
ARDVFFHRSSRGRTAGIKPPAPHASRKCAYVPLKRSARAAPWQGNGWHPSQPMPHRLGLNAGTPLLAEAFVRQWGPRRIIASGVTPVRPPRGPAIHYKKTDGAPPSAQADSRPVGMTKDARECHREAKSFFFFSFVASPTAQGLPTMATQLQGMHQAKVG